ncbi:hypothetical protein LGN06_10930, partial [Burkholderia vietnamiensis]|nr:hypothetical protein [Burkholderia vietnamiensis]
GLGFLQKPDDLLFRKALLHVRLLLRKRTLLDSGWPCLQGAGQNPYIGYKRATAVAKEAHESGKSIREVVLEHRLMTDAQLDDALQPEALIRPRAY